MQNVWLFDYKIRIIRANIRSAAYQWQNPSSRARKHVFQLQTDTMKKKATSGIKNSTTETKMRDGNIFYSMHITRFTD